MFTHVTKIRSVLGCFLILITFSLNSQITVAPLSCYPQFSTAAEMDAAAGLSGTTPFATWKGAYDYAIANSINTIDFVEGTYSTDLSGFRSDWGDADGGFVLPVGMTVNGNGAVIDNAPVGSSQICFATLSTNSTVNGFVFKQLSGNPNGGALFVPSSADNWTINDCDFFNCNQGTDALIVNLGATTGYITGCDFYGNSNPNAVYPESPGLPSSSALVIEGSLASDLNITNSTFSCNFRNVSGGAVQIHDDVHVDFDGCTFYRNEANSSKGGAMSIREGADVTINNTSFIDNFATASSSADDGALNIQSGSNVDITNCFFKGNESPDDCGAIFVSGGSANITFVTISNTIFEDNSASDDGGTVEFNNYSNVVVDNCLFLNNSCGDKGGAIYVRGTSPNTILIENTTITGNNNPGEGAITVNGTSNNMTVNNCVIVLNQNLDIHIEEQSIVVNNTNYGSGSGTFSGTGNTSGYTPDFDGNYNDASGKGWTGAYSSPVGSGFCPSPPAPISDCVDQGSISGVTFDDSANDDGIDDGTPLAGVTVELFNCDGTSTGMIIITGATGEFYFGNLDDGACFYLAFTPPGAYNTTLQNGAGSTAENDSDLNPTTGLSPQITIDTDNNNVDESDNTNSAAHYVTVDAGFTTTILPVKYSSINVTRTNCNSSLIWTTASEINNSHFEIERMARNSKFETIGKVMSVGNGSFSNRYSFTDENPDFSEVNYYRIKQLDLDGKHSFSNVFMLSFNDCGVRKLVNEVFPNPFLNYIELELNSEISTEEINYQIIDITGKLMLNRYVLPNESSVRINTEELQAGIYFISVMSSTNNVERYKVIKR